jgi:hypothetical protein
MPKSVLDKISLEHSKKSFAILTGYFNSIASIRRVVNNKTMDIEQKTNELKIHGNNINRILELMKSHKEEIELVNFIKNTVVKGLYKRK